MDKATLDKIIEMNDQGKSLVELHGVQHSYHKLYPQFPPQQDCLELGSLTGLVDYINQNKDGVAIPNCVIHVEDHETVVLYGAVDVVTKVRPVYAKASINKIFRPYPFNDWVGHENFMIKLYSLFQKDEKGELDKFTSTVRMAKRIDEDVSEDVKNSTKRSKSSGIDIPGDRDAFVAKLKPFRTFAEVAQPTSSFIFRIREKYEELECALFECDGGAWVNAARANIKAYLNEQVKDIPVFA